MNDRLQRAPAWRRNDRLEDLLCKLGRYLGKIPPGEYDGDTAKTTDLLFICSVGRSGTSLLLQYLAASGLFAYPSNLISRFYMAPYIGELIQTLLLDPDFDHGDQFADLRSTLRPISFTSELGKTDSTLDPNEFWYFWRRFFDFEQGARISKDQLKTQREDQFREELAEWSAVAGKPLVMKATTAAWNIARLSELLPKARFLIMRRDPVDVMISLLNARFRFWGNIDNWYGLVLPQGTGDSLRDPFEKVALQVAAFDHLVIAQSQTMSAANRYVVDYEAFCTAPNDLWTHEIMAPYMPARGQISDEKWKDYLSLRFAANRAVPDEDSPHKDVSRSDLLALYRRFSRELKNS